MNKRTKRNILNWTMLVCLLISLITGFLLKAMPGMWLGITHTFSSLILFVTALIHTVQNGMLRRRKK